jgi:cytochrome c biogenesis protein CcdA
MNSLSGKGSTDTLLGAFVVGASSAAVASPCTSPVVGGVLAALSQVNERFWGMALMFFFATGLSFLFLLLGLGLAKASALPKAGNWMRWVHKGSSVLLAFGGIYFMFKGAGLM